MGKSLINFVLVGAKNTGKTVFIASLSESGAIVASDDFTINYVNNIKKEFYNNKLPKSTASALYTLNFLYKTEKYNCQFSIDDYDGYYVETLNEPDELSEEDKDKLKTHIKYSEGILFLFPYEKDEISDDRLKRFANQIDTFISLLKRVYPNVENFPIPVVIMVNKWDNSPYFKQENEIEKAIEYIESIPTYKRARNIIEKYFKNVHIMVGSALQLKENKLKIEPYKLDEAINFFFEQLFSIFEEKVEKFKKENNYQELFKYLIKIKEDIKFYKNGKLLKILEETELKLYNELSDKIKGLTHKQQLQLIRNDYSFLYENLSQNLRDDIDTYINATLTSEKKKRYSKIFKTSFAITISIIFISIFIFLFQKYSTEKKFFNNIKSYSDRHNYINVIKLGQKYLSQFSNQKFFLFPFSNLKKHISIVEEQIERSKVAIEQKMKDKIKSLKTKNIKERYNECKKLSNEFNLFKSDILLKIKTECEEYAKDFNNLKFISNALLSENPDKILTAINLCETSNEKELNNYLPKLLEKKQKIDNYLNELKNEINNETNLTNKYNLCKKIKIYEDSQYPLVAELRNMCSSIFNIWENYQEGLTLLSSNDFDLILDCFTSMPKSPYKEINQIKEKLEKKIINLLSFEVDNLIKDNEFDEEKIQAIESKINKVIDINNKLNIVCQELLKKLERFKEILQTKEFLNDLKISLQNKDIQDFNQIEVLFEQIKNDIDKNKDNICKYYNELKSEIDGVKILLDEKIDNFLIESKKRIRDRYRRYADFLDDFNKVKRLYEIANGYYKIETIKYIYRNDKLFTFFKNKKKDFEEYNNKVKNDGTQIMFKLVCNKKIDNELGVDDDDTEITFHTYHEKKSPSRTDDTTAVYLFGPYKIKENFNEVLHFESDLFFRNEHYRPNISISADELISLLTCAKKEIRLKKEKGLELYILLYKNNFKSLHNIK